MKLSLNTKEMSAYQSAYDTLYFKDTTSLIAGYVRQYQSAVENIRQGIENPAYQGLSAEEVFVRWLDTKFIEQILFVGYHQALSHDDWSAFHCAQFSTHRLTYQHAVRASRQNYVAFDGPWGTGGDRSGFAIEAINALGGCDSELAKAYLPKEEGWTSKGYPPLVHVANLLMCMLYRDAAGTQRVIERAEKAAGAKSLPAALRAVLRYLIAVLKIEPAPASTHLREFMELFRKADWLHEHHHPLSKFCPRFAYGLYFASQGFLDPADFEKIEQPVHVLWLEPYVTYCATQDYRAGHNLIPWRDDVAFMHEEMQDLRRWERFPGGPAKETT